MRAAYVTRNSWMLEPQAPYEKLDASSARIASQIVLDVITKRQPTLTFDLLQRCFWLDRFGDMKLAELQAESKKLGLKTGRTKAGLIGQLTAYFVEQAAQRYTPRGPGARTSGR